MPPDKFRLWLSLFRYPVKTVQDISKIYESLHKVFDGQNSVYEAEFISEDYADDWDTFLSTTNEEWEKAAFDAMKLRINSVVVIDTPQVQMSALPEPYHYIVDIGKAIDYSVMDKKFEWIIYHLDPTHFIVIDDASYRIYVYKEKGDITKAKLESEHSHEIGYCPVAWFWDEEISIYDPDVKRNPLSTHLEEIDYLLFYLIAKNTTDIHASFPITWSFEAECDYQREDDSTGMYVKCNHGHLQDHHNQWVHIADGTVARCPVCSGSRITGPGTHIGVPLPAAGETVITPPAGHIEANIDNLDFIVKELERRKMNLYQDITGYGGEATNDQAVNEKQIIAAFEMRTGVLRNLKRNFEKIKIWIDSTKARIRYGEKFIGITFDMGTDFYLYDAATWLDMYQNAQKNEADTSILDILMDQYYATKYRNNPSELARYNIEKNLKPYRHLTISKAVEYYEKKIISPKDLQIILNFPTFVSRFEREQSSLLDFGKNLSLDKRVNAIKTILYSYAGTIQPIQAGQPGAEA